MGDNMFFKVKVNDLVRIEPKHFKDDLKETIKSVIEYEKVGYLDSEYGSVLAVISVDKVGEARVKLGDGAAYVDTDYTLLVFKPELHCVYEGIIKEVAEFGAFMGLGPFDGLIHVSQMLDDFINFDAKNMNFVGKETGLILSKDDVVMAKLVSISLKENVTQSKLGLTMRQDGLGKREWVAKKKE